MHRRIILCLASVLFLVTAIGLIHFSNSAGTGRVVGALKPPDVIGIRRAISHHRWAQLWQAATSLRFSETGRILTEIAQGKVREIGLTGQGTSASTAGNAYVTAGPPSPVGTQYFYTLKKTTNGWVIASAAYAK